MTDATRLLQDLAHAKAEAQLRSILADLSSTPLGARNTAETDSKPQEKGGGDMTPPPSN